MSVDHIDIRTYDILTIPFTSTPPRNYQYIILTDSNLQGIYNVYERTNGNLDLTDPDSLYSWCTIYDNYAIIDCKACMRRFPSAACLYLSLPNQASYKYVYDNLYTGEFIPWSGSDNLDKKTISWLQVPGLTNNWKGKKLCTYGDSIFGQHDGIETNGYNASGLPKIIADALEMDIYDRSCCGAAVTVRPNYNTCWVEDNAILQNREVVVYRHNPTTSDVPPSGISVISNMFYADDRIATIPVDSDVVLIMGGTNDANNTNLVVVNDVTEGSEQTYFTKALAQCVEKIHSRVPQAMIILAIEHWGTTMNNTMHSTNFLKIIDAINYVAEYYHLPVLDLFHRSTISSISYSLYLSDAIHPNTLGNNLLARYFVGLLKGLEPT